MSVDKRELERDVQLTLVFLQWTTYSPKYLYKQQEMITYLVFTSNASLVKLTSDPGISDHAIAVTESDVIPYSTRKKFRKIYLHVFIETS